jgi:NitT/TauT family transport system permease protein
MLDEKVSTLSVTNSPLPATARYEADLEPHELGSWSSLRTNLSERLPSLISLGIGVVAWEVAGHLMHFSFLPPLSRVVLRTIELIASGQILGPLAASMVSLFIGYGLAVVVGVVLGLLMGRYRTIEHLVDPYINALMGVPKLALVPVFYAIFGLNRMVQVVIVFLAAFFVIVINAMRGMQTVDPAYIEMARSFGAREDQLFWKILLPASLPLTLAGIRVAMSRAIKGMIRGEMVITLFGLGALLRKFGSRFDAESVFAVTLVVVAVALICSFIVDSIEKRLLRWTEPS